MNKEELKIALIAVGALYDLHTKGVASSDLGIDLLRVLIPSGDIQALHEKLKDDLVKGHYEVTQ